MNKGLIDNDGGQLIFGCSYRAYQPLTIVLIGSKLLKVSISSRPIGILFSGKNLFAAIF